MPVMNIENQIFRELRVVLFGSKTKSAHLVEHFLAKYIQEL